MCPGSLAWFFKSQAVNLCLLNAKGFGDANPAAPNDTPEYRAGIRPDYSQWGRSIANGGGASVGASPPCFLLRAISCPLLERKVG
jgi:hypothetical protein